MPDVDVLDQTNGHDEQLDVLSPLEDTLSPHPVSTSDVTGESTDETAPPAKHADEGIKHEPSAEKVPSKPTATKPSASAAATKKAVGAGKPALSKVNPPGVKPSPTASPVKKTTTTTARTAMPPPKTTAPTHTRRTSVLPPKVQPAADKKPLSASVGVKHGLSSSVSKPPASAINKPPSRASMVSSPDPDTVKPSARPRTFITEAAKRTASISKLSVGVSKPPPGTAGTRSARTSGIGSISSLKEVKENGKPPGKTNDDLQQKLDNANEALSAKETQISNLESQVSETKSSLESALTEIQEKQAKLEELEQAKATAEHQLEETQTKLQTLQDERDADDTTALLDSFKAELDETKEFLQSEKGSVETLRSQITSLEADLTSAKSELEALRASSQIAASDAAAAAAVEHETLLKTRAELEANIVETSALRTAHATALGEFQQKLSIVEGKAKEVEKLDAELDVLRKEILEMETANRISERQMEEMANRISELEIEVLEARDAVEEAEDAKARAESKTKGLEDELSKARTASEGALEEKEKALLAQLDEVKKEHEAREAELRQEQEKLLSQLATLESELADARAASEKAIQEQQLVTEEHAATLQNLEESKQLALDELNAELQRIRSELESQEEILAAKVREVKREHDQRLQEAIQEANAKHGVDLQALRAESTANLAQVTQFHDNKVNGLEAEHAAILEEKTRDLGKQISKLTVELKATQDDLAKSKAALDASSHELRSLEAQLEVSRSTAELLASSATPDRTEEVNRLKKELGDARSDMTALQEVLAATNESIADMSNRHSRDTEVAAEAHVAELTKLKSTHKSELALLEKGNSELSSRLSDAHGEIATLKATITARPSTPVSARHHGHGRTGSGTVTKEEIQKMHEAHNLKMNDLHAEYEKKLRELREELEAANGKTKDLQSEVERKTMEISYLEQEQEESNDTITRLQADLDALAEA